MVRGLKINGCMVSEGAQPGDVADTIHCGFLASPRQGESD